MHVMAGLAVPSFCRATALSLAVLWEIYHRKGTLHHYLLLHLEYLAVQLLDCLIPGLLLHLHFYGPLMGLLLKQSVQNQSITNSSSHRTSMSL